MPGADSALSAPVRAHAFLALGKLALADGALAQRLVPMFVRELAPGSRAPVAVRNNILVVLCDLCVRFTSAVDRYVPDLAACLRDPHPLVRRHTLRLLSQLLLEDYLKWRGPLLFRFLACLVDADEPVRAGAEALLTGPLATKTPGLFAAHFVEAVFVLSGCRAHPQYAVMVDVIASGGATRAADGDDVAGHDVAAPRAPVAPHTSAASLVLGGPDGRRLRMHVYAKMLAWMTPEQRVTVASKLVHDVLGAVLDGTMPLAATHGDAGDASAWNAPAGSTEALVLEVLQVLGSRNIRLGGVEGAAEDDDAADGNPMAAVTAGLAAAKTRVLSRLARRSLLEHALPVLAALRGVLAAARSPLLRALMAHLAALFAEHGAAIRECGALDRQLVEELEFDLRRAAPKTAAATPAPSPRRVALSVATGASAPAALVLPSTEALSPTPQWHIAPPPPLAGEADGDAPARKRGRGAAKARAGAAAPAASRRRAKDEDEDEDEDEEDEDEDEGKGKQAVKATTRPPRARARLERAA
jgi:condensin-2 complex subunit D3